MKIKYPRSYHLPYSEKSTSDDKKMTSDDHFKNKNVVVTIKMDGENSSIYNDTIHARSLDSKIDSEDRRWLDQFRINYIFNKIDTNRRICGENLFYQHQCKYNNLDHLFYMFSIWDHDTCLDWETTKSEAKRLNINIVPEIYNGIYDKDLILSKFNDYVKSSNDDVEGFVVRNIDSFDMVDFKFNVNKFIRNTFIIESNNHWRHSKKVLNKLKNNKNPWNL